MKTDYLKFVQWNEDEGLFVGYCPDLFIRGVCHGSDEPKVYRQLCRLVADEIADRKRSRQALPKRAAIVSIPVAA